MYRPDKEQPSHVSKRAANRSAVIAITEATFGQALQILKDAMAKIPALKYAFGIVGIAAAISLAVFFVADIKKAVFGIPITIVLMMFLFLFARMTTSKSPRIEHIAIALVVAYSLLLFAVMTLLCTAFFFGWPRAVQERLWSQPRQGPNPTPVPGAPKVLFRPDFQADDLPYGWLYWGSRQHLQKALALPYSIKQMHAELPPLGAPREQSSPDAALDLKDTPEETDVSHMSKASYSVVIVNDTLSTALVEKVRLIINRYEKLPDRHVVVWHRKGLIDRSVTRLSLSPKQHEHVLFSGRDTAYQLVGGAAIPGQKSASNLLDQ